MANITVWIGRYISEKSYNFNKCHYKNIQIYTIALYINFITDS